MIGQNLNITRCYGQPATLLNDLTKIVAEVERIVARAYSPSEAEQMVIDACQEGLDRYQKGEEPLTQDHRMNPEDRSGLIAQRKALNVSRTDMASRMGVSTSKIVNMETGKTKFATLADIELFEKFYKKPWSEMVTKNDVRIMELKDYMDDQGWTARDIAKLLGEDLDVVKEWIEDPGEIPVSYALEITDAMGLNPRVVYQPKNAEYIAK